MVRHAAQRSRRQLAVPGGLDLANAIKPGADIYRAPWDLPWPPAIGNIGEAWSRGQLGAALANSAYVTAMTVAIVLVVSVSERIRSRGCDHPFGPCSSWWSWRR